LNRLIARRDDALVARITGSRPLSRADGAYVRAGSALVRDGARLLAVQDDAHAAVWIDPVTRALEPLVLEGAGGPLPKSEKPDFEAAFVRAGTVWVLGSGSKPSRRRVAQVDAARSRVVAVHDRSALYEAVAVELGMPPNIEGAVPVGDRLRLFHRGPGRRRDANFVVDVPLAAFEGGSPRILSVLACDLGELGGLYLGFTDAVPLDAGRIAYLAVAEDTPDGIADGPIAGAAVGILEEGGARWAPLLEADGSASRRKVEGVALDPDGRAGWLLTDPDDPALPAELCRVELGGFG
jgi:hypothetical protein